MTVLSPQEFNCYHSSHFSAVCSLMLLVRELVLMEGDEMCKKIGVRGLLEWRNL